MLKHIRIIVLIVFFTVSILTSPSIQNSAYSSDKSEDIKNRLQRLLRGAIILSVQPAPLEGFWEVVISSGGKKTIVYIDPKEEFIVAGNLIQISSMTDLTKSKLDEINRVDISKIPLDDALILGNPKAKYKVIVFNDPD